MALPIIVIFSSLLHMLSREFPRELRKQTPSFRLLGSRRFQSYAFVSQIRCRSLRCLSQVLVLGSTLAIPRPWTLACRSCQQAGAPRGDVREMSL